MRVPPFVASTMASRAAMNGFERPERELATMIVEAWARLGRPVKVWLDGAGNVRSNLVNGVPPQN